jgi:hypothetical protein
MIIRIGGLPCDVMDAFSGSCGERADRIGQLQADLQSLRQQMVDCLHTAIHGAAPEKRRVLLAAKRDCFNGRPIAPYRQTSAWMLIEDANSALANRMLALEDELNVAHGDFRAVYEEELDQQQKAVAVLAVDPVLRYGLAIANPQVAQSNTRIGEKAAAIYGRREKRLATTLARYVSRAALKLSPFSTLTPTGLLSVEEGDEPLTLIGSAWPQRSLVRVRRHILDRCSDLLLRCSAWRRSLPVSLNDSALRLDDGRTLFLRPSRFAWNEEKRRLEFQDESLVRVRLPLRLVDRLSSLCARVSLRCDELAQLLAAELEVPEDVAAAHLERLLDIGFLNLVAPWSSDEGHLEKTLIREWDLVAGDDVLARLISQMKRVVEIQDNFLEARNPLEDFLELDQLIPRLLESAALVGGLPGVDVKPEVSGHNIYHDVWHASSGGDAIARIGRAGLEEALRSVDPLLLWTRLFDHRIDFQYSLGALMRAHFGSRQEIPLLEVFDAAQPLWQAFMKFRVESRDDAKGQWPTAWNPLSLPVLDELVFWRDVAHRGIDSCLIDKRQGRRVAIDAFHKLLSPIPHRFTEGHGGACLFLQPASRDGSLWVLNRLKEGTGRFSSRYTPLMPPRLRHDYGAGLARRATFEIDGEPVQLLDIHCVRGDTLNLHTPQTPKVLTFPGTHLDIAPDRRRTLRDLVITMAVDGTPHVRDRAGMRYLPVHLGLCYHDYLPTLVKFLGVFGPGEMGSIFTPPLLREVDGVTIQERNVIGNVVLHRTSWRVSTEVLRRNLDASCEAEAFAAFRRFHKRHSIPERVFVVEKVPHPTLGSRFQPQYLDLASPLFIRVLRSMLASQDETLEFVEMLPSLDTFPKDAEGRAWAVELLVDSLALREDIRISPFAVQPRQARGEQPQS